MKYRVLEMGDRFYPQTRCFFIWRNLTCVGQRTMKDAVEIIESEKEIIKRMKAQKLARKNKKIHPID